MNKIGLAVGCAAAAFFATGYAYQGAEAAAVGPLQIDTEAMQAILTIIAFFVPMIVSQFSPTLGALLKKLFDQFLPKPAGDSSLSDLLRNVNEVGTALAARGDKAGVKCCCDLHDHLLNQAAAEHDTPECDHDHDHDAS